MKSILNLFSMSANTLFMHKVISCVVLLCIMLGSVEFVPVKYDLSFLKTAKISSDTVINHLFSLSSFTMNAISKLFMQTEQGLNNGAEKTKNNNKTKKEKTSKEASSFSVLPADVSFSSSLNKSVSKIKHIAFAINKKISISLVLFEDFSKVCKEFMLLNIMLFILMMFLIKKNTSSDNYNNIELKNTCISLA